MPVTFANEKTIVIHREMPKTNFLQIKNENWMAFNKAQGPFALQLYLYLAKNNDNYRLTLSPQAAENEAGIKKTTFHKYVSLLIAEGYLVHRNGNTYDFYETPHQQEEKRAESTPCGRPIDSLAEQENLSSESRSSPDDARPLQPDEEADSLTDIIDN